MEIDLNDKIIIQEFKTWMDGGSVMLDCTNEKGQQFEIEFVQSVILNPREFDRIPGRLYFCKKLVEERSDLERILLNSLKKVKLENFTQLEEEILQERIRYVKSNQFILDIEKTKNLEPE